MAISLNSQHCTLSFAIHVLHYAAFLYNSSNDCKIKWDINRMKKILSVPFFVTTWNKKTETHDWINLVNILYAILRYYVIRHRFLFQKIPTELAVPPASHILCAVWEDPRCTNPGRQIAVAEKFGSYSYIFLRNQ